MIDVKMSNVKVLDENSSVAFPRGLELEVAQNYSEQAW